MSPDLIASIIWLSFITLIIGIIKPSLLRFGRLKFQGHKSINLVFLTALAVILVTIGLVIYFEKIVNFPEPLPEYLIKMLT